MFKFYVFMWIKRRREERARLGERENMHKRAPGFFHSLVLSPKACNGQGWIRIKAKN